MLQVVAFLAMEAPSSLHCDSIRDEQVKVFRTSSSWTPSILFEGNSKATKAKRESHRIPPSRRSRLCASKFNLGVGRASRS